MIPIQTRDIWIAIEADGTGINPLEWAELIKDDWVTMVEKKSDMVVMTKEQLAIIVGDAFNAGERCSIDHSYTSYASTYTAPNKTEYINQLIK